MTARPETSPAADTLSGVLDLLDTAYSRFRCITDAAPEDSELDGLRRTLGLLTMDLEAVVTDRGVRA